MQSTGHTSTQERSLVPMHGSAITYVMRSSSGRGQSSARDCCTSTVVEVKHPAHVDRVTAAFAAHLQEAPDRGGPGDELVELRQLQQGQLAQALVGELVA